MADDGAVVPPTGVHRDAVGVPWVVGADVAEVARLQGRCTAEDRAWQVRHARLKARGETARLLGPAEVPWDRFARRAGLADLGRRATDGLDPASRAFVEAYVAGLDEAWTGPDDERWEVWMPAAVFAAHHVLFGGFPRKLWSRHCAEVLGEELAGLFDVEGQWGSGSNSWVVGGERTASGLPMVGGDPHRTFESPNPYQQVRLTCLDPDDPFDVVGFTFPGVPGVQHFAHAGRVAWGITNAMADYQDLVVERLSRDGTRVRAAGPRGWEPVDRHTERIEVAGGPPVEVEVLRTPRGRVVAGGPDDGEAFSLRTAADVLGDVGLSCLLPLLRSRTADDVVRALGAWVEPVNNLLVADRSGAVRQAVVGRVPSRGEPAWERPVPADHPAATWQGWVEDLPAQEVGPADHLVTANHRMTPAFGRIGTEFAPPNRASRIDALLAGRSDLTTDDFAAIHRDTLAGQPAALHRALGRLEGLAGAAEALRAELAAWDQRFTADSTAAAAYARVREVLVDRLSKAAPFAALTESLAGGCPFDPLFDAWFVVDHQLALSLANLLSDRGRALVPDLDGHLAEALAQVAAEQVADERAGRPRVRWAERHRFSPWHAAGHRLPESPGLPGDNDCVRCAGALPGSEVAVRGSVARYSWDLAGFDRSGWVVPLGAHDAPDSPHHHDQLAAWVEGRLLPPA